MPKKVKAEDIKCKNCGGELIFDPKTQDLLCENCNSTLSFEKSQEYEKHSINDDQTSLVEYKKWIEENKFISCENCGANIILNKFEFSQKCPYCGSPFVVESNNLPGLKPDTVIPFMFDEETAAKKFRDGVKNKFLVPKTFKKQLPWNKVLGFYIPSFCFDARSFSTYVGTISKTEQINGKMHTKTRMISGKKSLFHENVTVEASSKLSQWQLSSLLPYNHSKSFKFDENFIRGYVVEHYDTSLEDSVKSSQNIMHQEIRSSILRDYRYDFVSSLNIDSTYSDEKFLYKLLPVYKFEYEYKGKKCETFMNGQTGKIGSGLPKSGLKITFLIIIPILIIIASIVCFLIFNYDIMK